MKVFRNYKISLPRGRESWDWRPGQSWDWFDISANPADTPHMELQSYVINPWERQANESDQDWMWFQAYRDSAYPNGYEGAFEARTFKLLAARFGTSEATLKGRANSYSWNMRAGAWDRELERRRVSSGMHRVDAVNYAHQRLLDKTRDLLEKTIDHHQTLADTGQLPSIREGIALAELQLKYDRLTTGQSTENVSVRSQHNIDVDRLDPDEIKEWKRLVAKATVPAVDTTPPRAVALGG